MKTDNLVSFFADDTSSPVQRRDSITVWRDNSQPLSSHIEVPYSPELNNDNFTCESGDERLNLTYKLAGTYNSQESMHMSARFATCGQLTGSWYSISTSISFGPIPHSLL